ncbi:MAG: LytTR family DNA-binding domain-containing protein [Campylobacterales bacterium]|nr:LytTR family DNA-binding domain-containing protein [Campylobacterales bacterium]
MKVLVVDDVALARERVERILKEDLNVENITQAENSEKAKELLENERFDIAFLDIEMPGESGLELADFISRNCDTFVVFVTAYDNYALEAFSTSGFGYLLKPVSKSELGKILERIKPLLSKQKDLPRFIMGKMAGKLYPIFPEEIVYVTADLNEVIIRTKERTLYVSMKISDIKNKLQHLFKVHRSHLVNLEFIDSFESIEQSKYIITFKDIKEKITTSKEGGKNLREFWDNSSI